MTDIKRSSLRRHDPVRPNKHYTHLLALLLTCSCAFSVVGGHSGVTIVPLLSQSQPPLSKEVLADKEKVAELVKRIQFGGDGESSTPSFRLTCVDTMECARSLQRSSRPRMVRVLLRSRWPTVSLSTLSNAFE